MARESLISVLGKIVADEAIPEGTLYAIAPRKQVLGPNGWEPESVEEWAKRCFYIANIGKGRGPETKQEEKQDERKM